MSWAGGKALPVIPYRHSFTLGHYRECWGVLYSGCYAEQSHRRGLLQISTGSRCAVSIGFLDSGFCRDDEKALIRVALTRNRCLSRCELKAPVLDIEVNAV